jgi:hypothetical protein
MDDVRKEVCARGGGWVGGPVWLSGKHARIMPVDQISFGWDGMGRRS